MKPDRRTFLKQRKTMTELELKNELDRQLPGFTGACLQYALDENADCVDFLYHATHDGEGDIRAMGQAVRYAMLRNVPLRFLPDMESQR
jgi:hypothetical protein